MFDFNVVLFKPVQKNQNLVAWILFQLTRLQISMKIASAYSVRLRNFCRVFDDTVEVYRKAVDFFIEIMLRHRDPKFTEL